MEWIFIFSFTIPRSSVSYELVEGREGDGVLGFLLVVGHAGVLEPVPPQYLVWQVGGSNLVTKGGQGMYTKVSTDYIANFKKL